MRVLVVDDDPATLAFMKLAFDAAGDSVDIASGVDDAIRLAAAQPPDAVLCDLTFGDDASDGFRLLRTLRGSARTAHVGVLAVSGADLPEVMRATEERGFDGFVAKPVDVASLVDRVHRLGAVVVARRDGAHVVDGE
ncbi:response regulator [Ilumatobacter nonamiensis]|uniref:response regulator n=1 Tax=Ilumatobacter nonamiensis TaxID=467093 RepID=UPI0006845942|nr:response regulator [Ilumatobacter nonamiensis]